ncbi:hypothetical protein QU516_17385 (plasmid) [Moellerella wisconsensis]|uniref:hypothetical protein n=1 Tax=Moellerella wisconsensis TaxID=158849 RepID=UPI0025B1DF9A|nr:hypothetical protein [Moellerella wisconsensis]WJW83911.1 hypothetical protein QU516_17385 [Moellerella wisconsensis]
MKNAVTNNLPITPKIKEKAKSMVLASAFGEFISTATNFELAKALAKKDDLRVNRHIRSVAKNLVGTSKLDLLNTLISNIASSSNTEKALNDLLHYRDRFISSAEIRVAAMNEYIGGDLDDLESQGVPLEELTQRVSDFRAQYSNKEVA